MINKFDQLKQEIPGYSYNPNNVLFPLVAQIATSYGSHSSPLEYKWKRLHYIEGQRDIYSGIYL